MISGVLLMSLEKPNVMEIEKIVDEGKDFKTFLFRHNLGAKPGQFVMVWLPRVDEKPFSISFQDNERFAITVMKVGPFTEKLFKLKPGDKLGIRGPYGSTFTLSDKKTVLVGGGCGTAPMGFLAEELKKAGADVNFIIGAKSKDYLIYLDRMKKAGIKTFVTTDDGSFGVKGFTTELLKDFIEKNKLDMVYACGPEVMLKPVVEMCAKASVPCEVSMERYMKCGFGICGQCCVDDSGVRVCKEGPVFSGEKIIGISEFGSHKRSASGKKVDLWHC
jgi:dihydroorotate dehydrogenase electron transfer subunit